MLGVSFPARNLAAGDNVPDRPADRRRELARAHLQFLFLF
jgi:hypothetical protein